MFGPPKPLSERLRQKLIREVDGDTFAGTAIGIEDVETEAEITMPETSLVSRLQRIKPKTPAMREHIAMMVADLMAIELAANELLSSLEGERREELKSQLEEIRRRGRQQQAVINKLESHR